MLPFNILRIKKNEIIADIFTGIVTIKKKYNTKPIASSDPKKAYISTTEKNSTGSDRSIFLLLHDAFSLVFSIFAMTNKKNATDAIADNPSSNSIATIPRYTIKHLSKLVMIDYYR